MRCDNDDRTTFAPFLFFETKWTMQENLYYFTRKKKFIISNKYEIENKNRFMLKIWFPVRLVIIVAFQNTDVIEYLCKFVVIFYDYKVIPVYTIQCEFDQNGIQYWNMCCFHRLKVSVRPLKIFFCLNLTTLAISVFHCVVNCLQFSTM